MKVKFVFPILLSIFIASVGCKESDEIISVQKISLNHQTLSMTEGDSEVLKATIKPDNATNKELQWSSSSTAIATVDQTGKVTALSQGQVTITANIANETASASCRIEVYPNIKSITLDPTELDMTIADQVVLHATISPENALNKELQWSSSSTAIATVDQTGKVTALSQGQATITVNIANETASASCLIEVYPIIQSVTLDQTELDMSIADRVVLHATISPENVLNKELQWSSSNNDIATVNQQGEVLAVAPGNTIITVTVVGSDKSAQCTATVKSGLEYIDESGVNQGNGVEINGVIWAPVNCGYNAETLPYGKLYQWGRKDGQGYNSPETPPTLDNGKPESAELADANTFYKLWDHNIAPNGMWGGEDGVTKTTNDPCPEGWRVPNANEFNLLAIASGTLLESSTWSEGINTPNGKNGRWFGANHATATADNPSNCIFLAASGNRLEAGLAMMRDLFGGYWSSSNINKYYASSLYFGASSIAVDEKMKKGRGFSVRCVKMP